MWMQLDEAFQINRPWCFGGFQVFKINLINKKVGGLQPYRQQLAINYLCNEQTIHKNHCWYGWIMPWYEQYLKIGLPAGLIRISKRCGQVNTKAVIHSVKKWQNKNKSSTGLLIIDLKASYHIYALKFSKMK